MKYLIRLLACGAVLAALSVPALPQEATPTQTPAATQTQEEIDAARFALYGKFYAVQQKEPAAAYEFAKEYLAKYPTPADQYQDAVKKFVGKYEMEQRYKQLYDDLKASRFDNAFTVGKQVVVDRPDDLRVYYDLTVAGLLAATLPTPNIKNNADAIVYANKTLSLVNSGKTLKNVTKDQILSDVYSVLGETATTKAEEVNYRVKAAQTKVLGKDPANYFNLALAYQEGEHTKATEAYSAVSKTGKPDDPEVKAALKTLQEASDRLLDALARTVVYSTTPETASFKTNSMPLLTSLYKFRNKTDVGLQAFINGITARPLPEPGQPIDYFPPPAPVAATTPTDGMTATPTNGATGATTPANGTATPATAAGTTKPAAKKPAPKPARKPKKG